MRTTTLCCIQSVCAWVNASMLTQAAHNNRRLCSIPKELDEANWAEVIKLNFLWVGMAVQDPKTVLKWKLHSGTFGVFCEHSIARAPNPDEALCLIRRSAQHWSRCNLAFFFIATQKMLTIKFCNDWYDFFVCEPKICYFPNFATIVPFFLGEPNNWVRKKKGNNRCKIRKIACFWVRKQKIVPIIAKFGC